MDAEIHDGVKAVKKITRLDVGGEDRDRLLPLCRLKAGEIWEDPENGHRVGLLDATNLEDVKRIFGRHKATLFVNDPPYNVKVGNANTKNLSKIPLSSYMEFSAAWIKAALKVCARDAHFYVWLGADIKDNFQPLPDFMLLMRDFSSFVPKNYITMRNQRGYGTHKNWMWVRQELLHYTKGKPDFKVVYTDIPKILKGYYKKVGGKVTENIERSKSENIRPGNVWVDIQQVFYRMEENAPGCYAQKPLKSIERIIETSSLENDLVADFFTHSGTTLIAAEKLGRRAFTFDNDPIFAELTIRRLENYRNTGRTGWQWNHPFGEID
jgi:site-specific DNA-methyltransferase (adenine-specific)